MSLHCHCTPVHGGAAPSLVSLCTAAAAERRCDPRSTTSCFRGIDEDLAAMLFPASPAVIANVSAEATCEALQVFYEDCRAIEAVLYAVAAPPADGVVRGFCCPQLAAIAAFKATHPHAEAALGVPWAGQLKQDRFVSELLDMKTHGYFVEVGANDGVSLSNTVALERGLHWTGVLVEPMLSLEASLRASRPGSVVEMVPAGAVSGQPVRIMKHVDASSNDSMTLLSYMAEHDNTEMPTGPVVTAARHGCVTARTF